MGNLRNVSPLDAIVRILLGLVLLGYAPRNRPRPFLAIGWGSLAVLLLGSGVLRICPLYTLIRGLRSSAPTPPSQYR